MKIILLLSILVACAMEAKAYDVFKSGIRCRNSCIEPCKGKPNSCQTECFKARGCGYGSAKRAFYSGRPCEECYERCGKLEEQHRNTCKEDCMIEKGCYSQNYRESCQDDCYHRFRGYQCDRSCKHYGTCCPDYDQYCPAKRY